jgi:hypothetical protein
VNFYYSPSSTENEFSGHVTVWIWAFVRVIFLQMVLVRQGMFSTLPFSLFSFKVGLHLKILESESDLWCHFSSISGVHIISQPTTPWTTLRKEE